MFEIDSLFTLFFSCLILEGVAIFQTLLLSAVSKHKLKPRGLLFILNPLLLIIAYLIDSQLAGWVFASLFASVFLLGIALVVKTILLSGLAYVQKERQKKKSHVKIGVQILLGLIALFLFQFLEPYMLFILIVIIVLAIFLTKKNARFFRLQGILATSKIQSVAMGLVEITGKTQAIDPVTSTYSSTSCIGYIYTIEEITYRTNKDGDRTKNYSQIHSEREGNDFEVTDETGTITVSFKNLDLVSIEAGSIETGKKRYSEILLKEGMEVLIIGNANTREGVPYLEYSKSHNVFGIALVESIDFYNKFKPLRSKLERAVLSFLFITAIILFLPIKFQNNKIIFDELDYNPIEYLKRNFSEETVEPKNNNDLETEGNQVETPSIIDFNFIEE